MARSLFNSDKSIDETAVRRYRLTRLRTLLVKHDVAGIVICDPINLRYATGSRNMQVWTMHNFCRYAFVAADGPLVMFELGSSLHKSGNLATIDEIRPALSFDFVIVGPRGEEMARRWAAELADLVRSHGGGNKRIAIDRGDLPALRALESEGLEVLDGKAIVEKARAIKSPEEIRAFKASLETCEASISDMREAIRPGMRESEALGLLIQGSIARGGEYPETRLLTSGPRTNPWFQETGDRVMKEGDLLSFDTDLIGPYGFYNDISRSWIVGEVQANDEQRRLYEVSRQQLERNIELLRPGIGFMEFAEKAYPLPEPYLGNRYADIAHGCGLGVEYPLIWYPEDAEWGAYDGVFEENMIVCVESYVGAVGGREGVKLEQPVWITSEGPILLSDCPLDDHILT